MAEDLFLQALFYYVWLEEKPSKRNFASVLKLMEEAEVTEKGKPSMPDTRMKFLEATSPLKDSHPAVKQYNKCMRSAGDTVHVTFMLDEFSNVALPDDYYLLLFTMRSREIMTPDEVRKMDNKKCIIFIRVFDPIKEVILSYFYPKTSVVRMMEIRRRYE